MTDITSLGPHGLELLGQYEAGPGGEPATQAYLCSGGRYTLGLGATVWPNGDPVAANDICTPEQAIDLTNWSLRKFAAVVDGAMAPEVRLTQNERDALILMAYNIGPDAFSASSVVSRLNANPKDRKHAADAFAMWCKATNDCPEKYDLDDAYYQSIMKQMADGSWRWVGPEATPPKDWAVERDGDQFVAAEPGGPNRIPLGIKYCRYQRAYPGLLRRHLSEACLFMGVDWKQACRKDTVSIASYRVWDPNDGRWEDLVRHKTELDNVLPVAKAYPLAPEPEKSAQAAPAPVVPAPAQNTGPSPPVSRPAPVSPSQLPTGAGAGQSNAKEQPPVLKPAGPPTTLPPVVAGEGGVKPPHRETKMPEGIPYGIDPTAGAKPMETTERFIGAAMLWLANGLRVGMANGMKLSGGLGFVTVLFLDMMKSPVTAAVMLSSIVAAVCFVGWLFGVTLEKAGLRKKKRGEERASQLMY